MMLNPGSETVSSDGLSAYERSGLALDSWRRLGARVESPVFGFPRVITDQRPNVLMINPRAPEIPAAVPNIIPQPPAIDAGTPVPGAREAAPGGAPVTAAAAQAGVGALPPWAWWLLVAAVLLSRKG